MNETPAAVRIRHLDIGRWGRPYSNDLAKMSDRKQHAFVPDAWRRATAVP